MFETVRALSVAPAAMNSYDTLVAKELLPPVTEKAKVHRIELALTPAHATFQINKGLVPKHSVRQTITSLPLSAPRSVRISYPLCHILLFVGKRERVRLFKLWIKCPCKVCQQRLNPTVKFVETLR